MLFTVEVSQIEMKSRVGHCGKWTQHPHKSFVHINLYYMVNYVYVFAVVFSISNINGISVLYCVVLYAKNPFEDKIVLCNKDRYLE